MRQLGLAADDFTEAERVGERISLGTGRKAQPSAERTVDRIRAEYGPGVIGPAAALRAC
ncbi:hypothetical protein ABZZ79_05365 [Streptomyces sp. NPDC006458]|uniref:hypothetical protein n=1 Tax=Streptomyces sp. NPDC006458 TaxID=3154302 RepID=UPI0033A8F83A